MPRRYPTLDQRRSNAAFASSRSGPPSGAKTKMQRDTAYTFAARRLWQLSDDWEVNLLMNVFGPERMGSFALAFDPAAKFEIGAQKIDVARRRRTREQGSRNEGFTYSVDSLYFQNYEISGFGGVHFVDTHQTSEDHNADIFDSSAYTAHTTFSEDSTDRLRAKGTMYNEYESCKVHDLEATEIPDVLYTAKVTTHIVYDDGRIDTQESTTKWRYIPGSHLVPIVGNFGLDAALPELNANVKQFCADHLEDYLPQCLSSARSFNAFYNIAELKDLPLMIEKTLQTNRFLRELIKNPKTALMHLDKASGDAYLNYLFGYKSLEQLVKSLCRFPERAAKRFNYLLRKNAQRTSQRFTKRYSDASELGQYFTPSVSPLFPPTVYYEFFEVENKFAPDVEVRCVVNATINFPEVAVPTFSNSTYRDMIGLTPRIVDLYNLIPWSWLSDWFTGMGKYLNLVESIALDKDLINVGFVTCLLTSNFRTQGKMRVYGDYRVTLNEYGEVISEEKLDPVDIPFVTSGSMDYRVRFSVDDLLGVKSASDKQGLLDESQKSILGALFTKFT